MEVKIIWHLEVQDGEQVHDRDTHMDFGFTKSQELKSVI